MGAITRKFQERVDAVVTECFVYAPTELSADSGVKRVKIPRALWDTGASCSLVSSRVAKLLELESIGKTGVSGYNKGIDVKDTFLVHIGVPTGDIITNIQAMECDSDEYDAIIGMDVIGNGDFSITNYEGKTVFSFRIPSEEHIVFE